MTRLSRELRLKDLKLQRELAIARETQKRLMPRSLPQVKGVRVAAAYLPGEDMGGDLYDVFDMGNGCLGILIADISGYGLPAALVSIVVKTAFTAQSPNRYSAKTIMELVNREVYANTLEAQFATAFFAVLDCELLRMKYVNASHCLPLLCSADGVEELDTDGRFVGMFEEPNYEEKQIALHQGDRLLFYSDGLTEARNGEGRLYGEERVCRILCEKGEGDIQAVIEKAVADWRSHLDGGPAEDDLTLIGVEIVADAATEERVVIASEPQLVQRAETAILSRLEKLNYGERTIFAVRLAVEEAVINAMKHGNHMDKAKNVVVCFSVDEKEARISVADEGEGFDPSLVPDPTLDENLEVPHGRGLVLMRAYMDEVTFNQKGNQVTMVKRTPWQ